jgi:hypothetical protein
MPIEYETRTISIAVLPKGESTFSERASIIEITDECAGEFVTVKQAGAVAMRIDPEEWIPLRDAIDLMVNQCRASQ